MADGHRLRSEGQLDLTQHKILAVQRSLVSRGHAEAGVLILGLQLYVASEVPVEADSRFCGEARSRGDIGEMRERIIVDARLAVAEGELEKPLPGSNPLRARTPV